VNRGAKADGGTVSSLAVYIAPRTPGTYHLLATSKADPQESASAEVTVTKR
jgi:chitinase